jgi:hypothetical protein
VYPALGLGGIEKIWGQEVSSMADTISQHSDFLSDLPLPEAQTMIVTTPVFSSGPRLTPKQHIFYYDDVEWEKFVLEWATVFGEPYFQVRRFGGSGDLGIDVAGLVTVDGIKGVWDCFQCKHYGKALTPSNIWPEIFKLFRYAAADSYVLPRFYYFVAPRNCGPTLERLLADPAKLKQTFLAEMDSANSPLRKGIDGDVYDEIRAFAEANCDFSIFKSTLIDDIVQQHKKTPYHVGRFGEDLPKRPSPDLPTDVLGEHETRYITQLMKVYEEKYPGVAFTPKVALSHDRLGEHFRRQREDFFSAESLRAFARDAVPEATFTSLQEEVYAGVVDIAELDYSSGMMRLASVLSAAGALNVTANVLLSVTRTHDRKGMCHQLANSDRLIWLPGGES